ncbi:hypothetical protein CBOM_03463 [Ceraceosorus bombacis]|uniref:Uncharacterized protein n=1 Tax=Ceraceosorus bombacis TaxID=401625 RepID=A0A0P1BLC9_9BASI|nr:hypothetical protein CBOM_03463 [Ceraceosorus bombacis]
MQRGTSSDLGRLDALSSRSSQVADGAHDNPKAHHDGQLQAMGVVYHGYVKSDLRLNASSLSTSA